MSGRRSATDAVEPRHQPDHAMSTTDMRPDAIATCRRRHGRRGEPGRRVVAAAGGVVHVDRLTSGIGRHVPRQLAARPRRDRRARRAARHRAHRRRSDSLFDAGALPQLFSAFRVGLVFGVLVPLLLGLAVAVVPLQLGARSLAFPRLAAAGFWTWLGGLVLVVVVARRQRRPRRRRRRDGRPLPRRPRAAGRRPRRRGAASLATTVLTTRAPGMRMRSGAAVLRGRRWSPRSGCCSCCRSSSAR